MAKSVDKLPLSEIACKLSWPPEEFGKLHSISRSKVYEEISNDRLESFTIGSSRRISVEAGKRWLRRLEEEAK